MKRALLLCAIIIAGCGDDNSTRITTPTPTPAPPPAVGQFAVSTSANRNWSSINVAVNNVAVGTLKLYMEPSNTSTCAALADARLVTTVPAGTVTYTARSDKGFTWSGTQTVLGGGCVEVQLSCPNRDCTPAPPPPPPPITVTGTWRGTGNSTQCIDNGAAAAVDFCKEVPRLTGPLTLVLQQAVGGQVQGSIEWIGYPVTSATGSLVGDRLQINGSGAAGNFDYEYRNWNSIISGNTMTGNFSWLLSLKSGGFVRYDVTMANVTR